MIVAAISVGFAEMTVMLKQQCDCMAGVLGEIGKMHRHIVREMERTWEELERMWHKAWWANDNMYAAVLTSVTYIFRSFSLLNFALVNRLKAREWGEGYTFMIMGIHSSSSL